MVQHTTTYTTSICTASSMPVLISTPLKKSNSAPNLSTQNESVTRPPFASKRINSLVDLVNMSTGSNRGKGLISEEEDNEEVKEEDVPKKSRLRRRHRRLSVMYGCRQTAAAATLAAMTSVATLWGIDDGMGGVGGHEENRNGMHGQLVQHIQQVALTKTPFFTYGACTHEFNSSYDDLQTELNMVTRRHTEHTSSEKTSSKVIKDSTLDIAACLTTPLENPESEEKTRRLENRMSSSSTTHGGRYVPNNRRRYVTTPIQPPKNSGGGGIK